MLKSSFVYKACQSCRIYAMAGARIAAAANLSSAMQNIVHECLSLVGVASAASRRLLSPQQQQQHTHTVVEPRPCAASHSHQCGMFATGPPAYHLQLTHTSRRPLRPDSQQQQHLAASLSSAHPARHKPDKVHAQAAAAAGAICGLLARRRGACRRRRGWTGQQLQQVCLLCDSCSPPLYHTFLSHLRTLSIFHCSSSPSWMPPVLAISPMLVSAWPC